MISRPRPPLFLEGRSGGWAARAALPLGARGGRRGGGDATSAFRASAALREEAEERLGGVQKSCDLYQNKHHFYTCRVFSYDR